MQLKLVLFLFGISFIIFSGCKKENIPASSSTNVKEQLGGTAKHSKHNNETITWTYTAQPMPGTRTGTVVAQGAFNAAGTTTMNVHVNGDILHCSQTLVSPVGTLTMLSRCQLSTSSGIWWIVSGTGQYSELRGKGTLIMSMPGMGIVQELFTGKIRGEGVNEGDDQEE
jgi:hypothetical protein